MCCNVVLLVQKGRRQSLLIALLINAFFGMMSAGARSIGPLIAMRLLGGVGVGGSVPVVFSFLAELLPARVRCGLGGRQGGKHSSS